MTLSLLKNPLLKNPQKNKSKKIENPRNPLKDHTARKNNMLEKNQNPSKNPPKIKNIKSANPQNLLKDPQAKNNKTIRSHLNNPKNPLFTLSTKLTQSKKW